MRGHTTDDVTDDLSNIVALMNVLSSSSCQLRIVTRVHNLLNFFSQPLLALLASFRTLQSLAGTLLSDWHSMKKLAHNLHMGHTESSVSLHGKKQTKRRS